MASIKDEYTVNCNNHASNLTINLKDLLQRKELVDVMLVADGHLFSAHRLVLSAFSPYFRQMFAQMPVSQQAFGEFFISYIFIKHFYKLKQHFWEIFSMKIS